MQYIERTLIIIRKAYIGTCICLLFIKTGLLRKDTLYVIIQEKDEDIRVQAGIRIYTVQYEDTELNKGSHAGRRNYEQPML